MYGFSLLFFHLGELPPEINMKQSLFLLCGYWNLDSCSAITMVVSPGTETLSWDGHLTVCDKVPWFGNLAGVLKGLVTVTIQGCLGIWWQWVFPLASAEITVLFKVLNTCWLGAETHPIHLRCGHFRTRGKVCSLLTAYSHCKALMSVLPTEPISSPPFLYTI